MNVRNTAKLLVGLCAALILAACGRPQVAATPAAPTSALGPTSTSALVLGPPTSTPAGDVAPTAPPLAVPPTPLPVGSADVTLPENLPLEFTPAGVPIYRLTLAPNDWAALTTTDPNVLGNTEFNATFSSGEISLPASVRLRGASTRFHPKKSFRVNIAAGSDFGGRTEINLLAMLSDQTHLLEPFLYDVMAQSGVAAPFARKVELRVNAQNYGLMTDVESVSTRRFLLAHGLEDQATIYRTAAFFDFSMPPSPEAYQQMFDQDTNRTTPDLNRPIALVEGINRTPPDQFAAWLSSQMDMPQFINYLVGNALISNDYIQHSRSYLIYEPGKARWLFVPWDLDNSALISWQSWSWPMVVQPAYSKFTLLPFTLYEYAYRPLSHDDVPRWSVLATRVIDTPEFRAQFAARLQQVLDTTFTQEAMNSHIDQLYAKTEPSALADPSVQPEIVRGGPAWLKQYVADRRAFIQSQLPALQAFGQGGIYLNEVGPGFVEIYNAASAPADLSGYSMSADLRNPTQYALPAGTTIPAGGFLVVDKVTVSPEGGEVGLFRPATLDQGLAGDSGVVDLLYYGPLAAGTSYARAPAGSEAWAVQSIPTPGS